MNGCMYVLYIYIYIYTNIHIHMYIYIYISSIDMYNNDVGKRFMK